MAIKKDILSTTYFDEISLQQAAISEMDPLQCDRSITTVLPQFNMVGYKQGVIDQANEVVTRNRGTFGNLDVLAARAATRDLGMYAASLTRHEIPLNAVPGLEETLLQLAEKTNEVPRETVFHYGPLNPQTERMRTFTGTQGERTFIGSFSSGMENLGRCVRNLHAARETSVTDPDFVALMHDAKGHFQDLVDGMVNVRRVITPQFFSMGLRPYFPTMTLGERSYVAPGGAQMPMIFVDKLMWGLDVKDADYDHYYYDNWQYLPPAYRDLDVQIQGQSLVAKTVEESRHNLGSDNVRHSIGAVREFMLSVRKFHAPHIKTAKENFAIRSDGSVGSGGYATTILDQLGDYRTQAFNRVQALYETF